MAELYYDWIISPYVMLTTPWQKTDCQLHKINNTQQLFAIFACYLNLQGIFEMLPLCIMYADSLFCGPIFF